MWVKLVFVALGECRKCDVLQLSLSQIDLDPPTGVIERFNNDDILVFPISVAVRRIPILKFREFLL